MVAVTEERFEVLFKKKMTRIIIPILHNPFSNPVCIQFHKIASRDVYILLFDMHDRGSKFATLSAGSVLVVFLSLLY